MPIIYYTKKEVHDLLLKQQHNIWLLLLNMQMSKESTIPQKQILYKAQKEVLKIEIKL
jgi:hypothetical protein